MIKHIIDYWEEDAQDRMDTLLRLNEGRIAHLAFVLKDESRVSDEMIRINVTGKLAYVQNNGSAIWSIYGENVDTLFRLDDVQCLTIWDNECGQLPENVYIQITKEI